MKWRQMTKWCWLQSRFTLLVLFIILVALYTCQAVTRSLDGVGININGNEMATFITLFVMGIVMFAETLRFGLVSGISRKTVFWSLGINAAIMGAVSTVGNVLVLLIGKINARPGYGDSLFEMSYKEYLAAAPSAAGFAVSLLWIFTGVLCAFAVGLSVGAVFYRLGRTGKVLWAVGLPVGSFVVLPSVIAFLPYEVQRAIVEGGRSLGSFLQASPYRMVFIFLAAAVVLMAVNWLLMRKAPLK